MFRAGWITTCVFVADFLIRVGLSLWVISRRLPVGVVLAWLIIILVLPFGEAILYRLIGEYLSWRHFVPLTNPVPYAGSLAIGEPDGI
jgi:hypothetical protein